MRKLLAVSLFLAMGMMTPAMSQVSNDNPCDDIELPVSSTCFFSIFTNTGALNSLYPSSGCITITRDVWFRAAVPASGILNIATKAGTLTDGEMAIYGGNSCTTLSEITCNRDSSTANRMPYISQSGLVPGSYIWIRFSSDAASGTFGICVTSPGVSAGPNKNVYLNKLAPGANNGLNWSNAFKTIAAAMGACNNGDTLHIAEGLYSPPDMQNAAGYNLKEGMVILGGYPNTGNPQHADRDAGIHPTVLSGLVTNYGTYISYIFHASNLSGSTHIDGVIFEKSFSKLFGTGSTAYSTAALTLVNSQVEVKNCVFRQCRPGYFDSLAIAVSCLGGSPRFYNCFFVDNDEMERSNSAVVLAVNSSAVFANCVFAKNVAPLQIRNNGSNLTITNCNFYGNSSTGWSFNNYKYCTTILGVNSSTTQLRNCILFGNKMGNVYFRAGGSCFDSTEIATDQSSVVQTSNTVTQVFNTGNSALLNLDPKFRDTAKIAGADNFYFTDDDGLALTNPGSDLLNKGDDSYLNSITADILGHPRIYGSGVDIGAYEVQSALLQKPAVLYVNANATGLNDGSNWTNAFTNLQAALRASSDTIKVAAGTYFPSATDHFAAFWLQKNRVLSGGYPNSGNPSDALRNPSVHPTYLSGDSVNNASNAYHVIRSFFVDSTCVVDGFTIAFGNYFNQSHLGWAYFLTPAAVCLTNNASPTFRNCIFYKNAQLYSVGVSIKLNSKPVFERCVFKNNAFANIHSLNSAPSFLSCRFEECGIFTNDSSRTRFDSCTFSNKTAIRSGAGVRSFRNSDVTINNSSFNLAHVLSVPNDPGSDLPANGGDIFNDHSVVMVDNSTFTDSTAAANGNCLYNQNLANTTFTKCVFNHGFVGNAFYNDSSVISFDHSISLNKTSLVINKKHSTLYLKNSLFAATPHFGGFDYGVNFLDNNNSTAFIDNSTLVTSRSIALKNTNYGAININNSIVWSSELLPGNSEIISDITSNVTLGSSMTRYYGIGGTNGNIVGQEPRFTDMYNVTGPDKKYFTADDGFTPCSCSPAINAGNRSLGNVGPVDLSYATRAIGNNVDIGAYEHQSGITSSPKEFFVNESAGGNNDGSSWQNAYTSVRDAFRNYCADTIKIAAGNYNVSVGSDTGLNVARPILILGGYPSQGVIADSLRDPKTHVTALDGNIGNPLSFTDNSRWLMRVSNNTSPITVDGLTFKNTRGTPLVINGNMALVTIRNCNFMDNQSLDTIRLYPNGLWSSGAVYCMDGNTLFDHCYFTRNHGQHAGLNADPASSIMVNRCIFEKNAGYFTTGLSASGKIKLFNSLFYRNTAGLRGAGAITQDRVGDSIVNCTFVNNNYIDSNNIGIRIGVGLFIFPNTSSTPNTVMANCIFQNNTYKGQVLANSPFLGFGLQGASGITSPKYIKVFNNASEGAVRLQQLFPAAGTNNISPSGILFKNPANAAGADNVYHTSDDGLQHAFSSSGINTGLNSYVQNVPYDFIGQNRIINGTVDMGANEYNGGPGLCAQNPNTSLQAPVAGNTYQWQVNSGSGFINVADGANIQGSNNQVLQLIDMPGSWAGNIFRCVTDGVASYGIPIEFNNVWLGSLSTAWEDPMNWSCGAVPDNHTNVIINKGTNASMQMPQLNSNQTIRSLLIATGSTLQINGSYTLLISP